MITYKTGDLLDSGCDIICHQVNCKGVMGSGIALQIRQKYPNVFTSYERRANATPDSNWLLGTVDFVPTDDFIVANLFAQDAFYPRSVRHTNYVALKNCLLSVKNFALAFKNTKLFNSSDICRIGIPYKIGCGLGGGDWEIVKSIIEDIFEKDTVISIEIWNINS